MKNHSTKEFDPRIEHRLLDTVRKRHNLKTDRALAHMLGIEQSVVSRIRSGKLAISPYVILQIHDATGMAVRDIKMLMPSA